MIGLLKMLLFLMCILLVSRFAYCSCSCTIFHQWVCVVEKNQSDQTKIGLQVYCNLGWPRREDCTVSAVCSVFSVRSLRKGGGHHHLAHANCMQEPCDLCRTELGQPALQMLLCNDHESFFLLDKIIYWHLWFADLLSICTGETSYFLSICSRHFSLWTQFVLRIT